MTDKNKRIKFLDMLWGCYYDRHTPSDKDKAMLTEIKQRLEQQAQSSEELDDLVEKISYLDILIMEEDPYEIHTFIPIRPTKKRRFELLREIRKLLATWTKGYYKEER